jgi:hypothetical protein
MTKTKCLLGFIALIFSAVTFAGNIYYCQDPKTGKQSAQDAPCGNATLTAPRDTTLNIEAARRRLDTLDLEAARVQDAKIREDYIAREQATWKRKREWEMAHPGTYSPEEVMTREEYGEYQKQVEQQQELTRTRQAAEGAERAARRVLRENRLRQWQ